MQGPNAVLAIVTYPPGASNTQARIVIDGTRGAIFEYLNGGPLGALASSWAATAGTDPYGNVYPAGFNAGPNSQFSGNNYVINNIGEFRYSGTPALGNLIYSDTSGSGTDPHGNTYLAGITNYVPTGGKFLAVNMFNGQVSFWVSPTANGSYALGASITYNVLSNTLLVDTPNTSTMQIGSNTNAIGIGNSQGLTILAEPIQINTLYPDRSLTDTTTNTNANGAGALRLSAIYTVPTDIQVGTFLEIEVPWAATWGSQTLQLGLSLNGSATFSCWFTVGGAIVATGVGINGVLKFGVEFTALGPSGTFNAYGAGSIQQNGANALFSNTSAPAALPQTGLAINTGNINTFRINSLWGGSNATQTVSGFGSTFTRKGA